MPVRKKRALLAASLHNPGSSKFVRWAVPVDPVDPEYKPSDVSSDGDIDSSDTDHSPLCTLQTFHSKKRRSALRGVYRKDSRTTRWRQDQKQKRNEEHLKRLDVPSIQTFFTSHKQAWTASPPSRPESNAVEHFVNELTRMVGTLSLGSDGPLTTATVDSESDSDLDSESSSEESD